MRPRYQPQPPTISGTPPVIPEEIPPVPAVTPPPLAAWCGYGIPGDPEQARTLDKVIDAFQDVYPGIRFEVTNFPQADLRRRYETAAYNGGGPSLLLAPAEWGPAYYDSGLVTRPISHTLHREFLAAYQSSCIGHRFVPGCADQLACFSGRGGSVSQQRADPRGAETFDELIAAARAATRAGQPGGLL